MIYAVLDTNVLVSALLSKSSDSTISKLIDHMIDGHLIPMYSQEIIDEYMEVLSRKKFRFQPDARNLLISRIMTKGMDSNRVPYDKQMPDEDDRVFYEVALSKDDAYLVTGNQKHFPVTPIVVTPAEMLEIIKKTYN